MSTSPRPVPGPLTAAGAKIRLSDALILHPGQVRKSLKIYTLACIFQASGGYDWSVFISPSGVPRAKAVFHVPQVPMLHLTIAWGTPRSDNSGSEIDIHLT